MKLSVLVDNNTIIDRYFLAEPAVSYFIECDDVKILFDAGYSDVFLRNADRMKIDVLSADYIVLSHGHVDHVGGLDLLIKESMAACFESKDRQSPRIVAHPEAFVPKFLNEYCNIGVSISEEVIQAHFEIRKSAEPVWLGEKIVFLGEIERTTAFENPGPIGFRGRGPSAAWIPDDLPDDTALAYIGKEGLYIITGCSHAGICNIVEQAKKVTGIDNVIDIIGGFHLLNPPPRQMQGTLEYFEKLGARQLYACHCTDFQSRAALAKIAEMKEVGSGMVIEFE